MYSEKCSGKQKGVNDLNSSKTCPIFFYIHRTDELLSISKRVPNKKKKKPHTWELS